MPKTSSPTTKTAKRSSNVPPILVEVVMHRWKDPVTGKFVKSPYPNVSTSLKRHKGETVEEQYLDGDLVKVFIRHRENQYGYQIPSSARVVYPAAREAVKKGELTLEALKELEKDIADGILEKEKEMAIKGMERDLMKGGHLSDKAKRGAETRKRNAERKAKEAAAPSRPVQNKPRPKVKRAKKR
ncbi:hypothetical protein [Deinococcus misasensis]|uniref:hypothetical protein n=1 Tax=Deinococcus misasensis TaxID=392413 RepID=UPI0005518224|nr:hypothetical protein [Deinococcus misasensis]